MSVQSAPAQLVPRSSSPFRAKLRAPARPDHYASRPRLLRQLDELTASPLTVVVAPAGAGKTSLLSEWTARTAVPTAWLSVDESDRGDTRFWTGLLAALDTLLPGCGWRAAMSLRRSAAAAEVVSRLLDDLDADDPDQSVLVVDDLHLVDDLESVTSSLATLLQHLPAWLHVVLLSRRDPRLPLDRMRARGQLRDLRFADLRLSPGEAGRMLSRLTPSLSDSQVRAVTDRAQGWAAGLLLATRSRQARRALGRRDLLVDDYVLREVLGAEDPALIEALSDIAVVDRVGPDLARALTGRPDAEELLLEAEARGLFVTRLDREGRFEVHALVREVLAADLARRAPGRLADRHVRAARWLEHAGEVAPALDHWLLGDRPRDALRLLAARSADLHGGGREATITRTVARIPAGVASADLESMIDFAWCHALVDRRRFVELVRQATWWSSRSPAPGTRVGARLTILRSMAATMTGDWAEGEALARQAMPGLGDAWWRDPLVRFGWNLVASSVALSERWDDDADGVVAADLALSRDPERRLSLEGTRALGQALAGRPVRALRVAAAVRRSAAVADLPILRAELAIAEAVAHRELGDRDLARAELTALAATPVEPAPYCRVLAGLELAQLHTDDGDLDAALACAERARALVDTDLPGPGGQAWLARTRTALALSAGHLDDARRWSERVHDPFWGSVCAARVHLAEGRRDRALTDLDDAVPRCDRHEVVLGLLRSRAAGSHDEAVERVTTAAAAAVATGMLQTVASEGGEVPQLVERAAWRVPESWLGRLRRTAPARPGTQLERRGVETLTDRERDVLRFLPSRLTQREIAGELCVSVNTVKFHLKVIYRKLEVGSRAEAATVARSMLGRHRGQP